MDKFLAGLISYAALFLCSIGVAAVLFWAERRRIMDIPNERSSHVRPTPRVGGLPIVLVTLGGLCLCSVIYSEWNRTVVLAYVSGALAIAVVSWLD
ncbi:MAG: glycosyl transferase, partial [Pseudomonadota bacterium]